MQGRVTQVKEEVLASELSAPATAGDTTLSVEDLSAFDWNGGAGQIVGGEFIVYTVVGAEDPASDEIALDDTPDPDGGTLSILIPLSGSYPTGTKVVPYPQIPERTAYVFSEDQEEEIGVRVPHRYVDVVPLGPRDEGTAESIEYEQFEDEKVLTDVLGDEPVADGKFLDAQHDESPIVSGLTSLTTSYQALDGGLTVTPEKACLALVLWGLVFRFSTTGFTINRTATASLLVNGVPTGMERPEEVLIQGDSSGGIHPEFQRSVAGSAFVVMEADQEYVLEIGAKSTAGAGQVDAAGSKTGGLSYGLFGG